MIPLRDNRVRRDLPLVMWTLVALNVVMFLWDRHLNVFGPSITFADLTMRPREVVEATQFRGDHFALVTLFTSLFMHGNLMHLLGNLVFLVVFGASIEEAFGSWRFALYYLAWGLVASATQIWVEPLSDTPTLGASGAIGGVLGSYFLMFPSSKVEIIVPLLAFLSYEVRAWVLLGLWFLFQIVFPQQGVANWAHAGGFLAGMVTVLIMGGRAAILKGREDQFEDELAIGSSS